jgi:hypothetical protein
MKEIESIDHEKEIALSRKCYRRAVVSRKWMKNAIYGERRTVP